MAALRRERGKMNYGTMKIVADSSADVLELKNVPFESAPLKIITVKKEYTDDADLDVAEMVEDMLANTEKSSTACPSPEAWINAFGDAQYVFCVTITSNLSGSNNSANLAKRDYEEMYPGRRVLVIDSLSAGPEMGLIVERLEELILEGKSFEQISEEIEAYYKNTGLVFILESLRNLANNGRVSKVVASAAGILGIRLLGKASDVGTLEPLAKVRGEKKALPALVGQLENEGYKGGKVKISHCLNEKAALEFKRIILEKYPAAQVAIGTCRGLCSFYAEKGGMLVGFEKN